MTGLSGLRTYIIVARRSLLNSFINEYRKYKRGRRLETAFDLRLSLADRQTLEKLSEHHGLSCSELVRVLLFREARREGFVTNKDIAKGKKCGKATNR